MTNEIALKPCRFCGNPPGTKVGPPALARCITPGCEGKSLGAETFEQWNTRALPAQGEPIAEALRRELRITSRHDFRSWVDISRVLAALLSSPAPLDAPQTSAERLPSSDAAAGAGDAIFQECAEIALEHVGVHSYCSHLVTKDRMDGYDEACRDIAEAIKLRASNRKTIDAVADATLLKP